MISVDAVPATQRDAVEMFYRAQLGRDVRLDPTDEPVAAYEGEQIVAAVRLHHRAGALILRTMVVVEGRRREGIGSHLLDAVDRAIGQRACYCFPWTYLEPFYARIDFRPLERANVPSALHELLGSGCISMLREART